MDDQEFSDRSPGRLIRNMEGLNTFSPDPLYPPLSLDEALRNRITEVSILLGRLDGMSGTLPDPGILIRPFVRREAQLSSYIENTFAKYEELAVAAASSPATDQIREVRNAELAITAGVSAMQSNQPITEAFIRQLHDMLLKDVRGHEVRGAYRKKQVYIGNQMLGPEGARFVPPAWHLVPEHMNRFEREWNGGVEHFALVRLAMLHYQFETIHPFEDGNGRLGRLLTLLGLCAFQYLKRPVINPSLHFERNRSRYYDGLLAVSTHGAWYQWVDFFLEGLQVAARESVQKLGELLDLQRDYHDRLRTARNSALLLRLVDELFVSPVITVKAAANIMDVTVAAAASSIRKLIDAKILRILQAGKPTYYVADRILRAVNVEPTRR